MKKNLLIVALLMLLSTMAFGQTAHMYLSIQDYLPQIGEDVKSAAPLTITVKFTWITSNGTKYHYNKPLPSASIPLDGSLIFVQIPFTGPAAEIFNVVKTCGKVTVNAPRMNCSRAVCGYEFVPAAQLNNWVNGEGQECIHCVPAAQED